MFICKITLVSRFHNIEALKVLSQGLKGNFGILDLTKTWCRIWENEKYIDRKQDLMRDFFA